MWFGRKTHLLREIRAQLFEIRAAQISDKEELMSQIDDLKTAMNDLVSEAVTDVEALIAKIGAAAGDNPEVAAVIQEAKETTAKLKFDMAALTEAPAPPPVEPPVPTPTSDQP